MTLLAAAVAVALPATPDDPAAAPHVGRGRAAGPDRIPLTWYQGVAAAPSGDFYFSGLLGGLYRTDRSLNLLRERGDIIPPALRRVGYNHVGDLDWDPREHGRVLIPLECYPCSGSPRPARVAVAGTAALRWHYAVRLAAAGLRKVTWLAVDRRLVWTSSGSDLLAFRADAIARRATRAVTAIRRVHNVLPGTEFTGGAFAAGSLWLARDLGATRELWRIDLRTQRRTRVMRLRGRSESEGLAAS